MKTISFGKKGDKEYISIQDTETGEIIPIGELVIPYVEARDLVQQSISDYVKYSKPINT